MLLLLLLLRCCCCYCCCCCCCCCRCCRRCAAAVGLRGQDPVRRKALMDQMPSSEAAFDRAIAFVTMLNFLRRLLVSG
jgi:hypothetical protein